MGSSRPGSVRGCRPPLWPQKNHAAGGAVWRKEQNGKNPHRFSPLFYHNRTVFVKRSARKREFPNCALLSREAYAKGADLSEFPLFSPLFPQKNFSLTRLSETPTPVRKRRRRPGQSAAFKKADFLRPAHDKLHFARRLLFPFGRLPSAGKTDVCREVCQKRSFAGEICRLPGLPGAPLGGAAKEGI